MKELRKNGNPAKQNILDIAKGMIGTGARTSITMNGIAAEVGITAPTLYHYFKGKDELFEEAALQITGEMFDSINVKFPKSMKADQVLLMAIFTLLQQFQEKENIPAEALLRDQPYFPSSFFKVKDKLGELLKNARKGRSGETHKETLLFALIVGYAIYQRFSGKELPESAAEDILKAVL